MDPIINETDSTEQTPLQSNAPTSPPQKNRQVRYIIFIVAILIGLAAIIGIILYLNHSQRSLPRSTPPLQKQVKKLPDPLKQLDIQFFPRQHIATASATTYAVFNLNFYTVGKVISGKYQGGELIDADAQVIDGPCKGYSCTANVNYRYLKLSDKIVFLPKISDPLYSASPSADTVLHVLFGKNDKSVIRDDQVTVKTLEYPKTLSVINPKLTIELAGAEQVGDLDTTVLTPVFHDSPFGNIYTTKVGLGPQDPFSSESNTSGPATGGIGECRGKSCFYNNAFFVFRPDGTYLMYTYTPPFYKIQDNEPPRLDAIDWKAGVKISDPYSLTSVDGCQLDEADALSVVDPKNIKASDLVVLGTVKSTGEPIYTFKDADNPMVKDFYDNYQAEINYYIAQVGAANLSSDSKTVQSYSDFTAKYPILVWKDPLGRYIRLINRSLLPPAECEPIIYLYPQKQETVHMQFDQSVHITHSLPLYMKDWNVSAQPDGTISNLLDGKKYPYLFWEGYSTFYPKQDKGFVVKQSNVSRFFTSTLPQLGLNQQETHDFMRAWVPEFTGAPYYFITFYDTATLNSLVPLHISPQPDTLIRVMMDFHPLQSPITVPELSLPTPPVRRGFVVVEWGSLKR